MRSEYEHITHNNSNFHIFFVNLLYRTPHIHKDYEISLVVDGAFTLINANCENLLSTGDIFIMNPFSSHELKAKTPALILSLQVSSAFFSSYYPQIEQVEFDDTLLLSAREPDICREIRRMLFELASAFFAKKDFAPLKCASLLNQMFFRLLSELKHHLTSEKEKKAFLEKGKRMRKILHYIENHYTEKILLSHIAGQENLDLYYLSHFFKENFGVTFQEYVTKLRCEKARQLLLLTDYSLLDVSICSGFSDPKYFNKSFLTQYGCTPRAYRQDFNHARLEQQQQSMLTAQEFLSESSCLIALDKFAVIP